MENKEINKRIAWIDIAKGIGIFLVILGHTYRANPVLNWICSFHMPLFFILSGWLRGTKPNKNGYLARKFDALIIPLIVFMTLTFLYWFLIERYFRSYSMGPMWFLPVLFVVEITVELLIMKRHTFQIIAGGSILSCLLLYCTKGFDSTSMIGWLPRCFGAAVFYLFGILFSFVLPAKELQEKKKKILTVASAILLVASIVISQNNGRVDLYNLMFSNFIFYLIAALAGSGLIYCLSALIGSNPFLEYLGKYSIIILCTHEQIKRVIIIIAGRVAHVPHEELRNQIIAGLLIAVIVLMIDLIVIQICKFIASKIRNTKVERVVRFIR